MSNNIRIVKTETLSRKKYWLKEVTFEYEQKDGTRQTKTHEVYDMGDATTVLLYNKERKTIILTKQFRLPTFLNGNKDGMMIEACAGKLDDEDAAAGIKREIKEETGYEVEEVQKIMEVYSTPGTVTEKLYLFVAAYAPHMKTGEGGGLPEEQEHVQVMELSFDKAWQMMNNGEIKDAKTIILLQYAFIHHLL